MKYPCTGVILAGGLNSRFSGRNKGMLEIGGKRFLDRICDVFRELFAEIILVSNDPLSCAHQNMLIVTDLFPVRSSLTGIHTGLFSATRDHVFFAACDAPFLKKELVQAVLDHRDNRFDVTVPETAAGLEPLCAVYSRNCLDAVSRHLSRGEYKIRLLLRKLRVRTVGEKVLREKDPDLLSFFNVNTPEDLEKAVCLAKTGR